MKSVILYSDSLRVAHDVGHKRWAIHRAAKHGNQLVDNPGDDSTDIFGLACELAYGKMWDLDPDLSLSVKGDRGYDFVDSGKTVNVKGTMRHNGRLMVPGWTKKHPDLWALVICSDWKRAATSGECTFALAGYFPGPDLLKEPLQEFGHGPTYAVTQERLFRRP